MNQYEKKYFKDDWYKWNANFELAHDKIKKNFDSSKIKQNIREIWRKINQKNIEKHMVNKIFNDIYGKRTEFEEFFRHARNYTSHYFHISNDYMSAFNNIKKDIEKIYLKFKNDNSKTRPEYQIFLVILIIVGTKGHKFIYTPKGFREEHNKLNCINVLNDSILSIYSNLHYLLSKLSKSKLLFNLDKKDKKIYDPRNDYFFISKIVVPYFKYLKIEYSIQDYNIFNNSEMNDEWKCKKSISKNYKNKFSPSFFYLKKGNDYIQVSIKKLFYCFKWLNIKTQLLSLSENEFKNILGQLFESEWKSTILLPGTNLPQNNTNKVRSEWTVEEENKLKNMLKSSFDISVTNKNQVFLQLIKTINLFYIRKSSHIYLDNYYEKETKESIKIFREHIFKIIKEKNNSLEFEKTSSLAINKYIKDLQAHTNIMDLFEKIKKDINLQINIDDFEISDNNFGFMKLLTYNKNIIQIIKPDKKSNNIEDKSTFMQKKEFVNLIQNFVFDKNISNPNEFIRCFFESLNKTIKKLELEDEFNTNQIAEIKNLKSFVDWYFEKINKSKKKSINTNNNVSTRESDSFKEFTEQLHKNLRLKAGDKIRPKKTNDFYIHALISNKNNKAFKVNINDQKIDNFKEFISLSKITIYSNDKSHNFVVDTSNGIIEKIDIDSNYMKLIIEIMFVKEKGNIKNKYSFEEFKRKIEEIKSEIEKSITKILNIEKNIFNNCQSNLKKCCIKKSNVKKIKCCKESLKGDPDFIKFNEYELCYDEHYKNVQKISFAEFKWLRDKLMHHAWNDILVDDQKIQNLVNFFAPRPQITQKKL